MLLGIQILGIFIGAFMLYITFLHKKRKEFTINEAGFWTTFWIGFVFIILFPHFFDFIIKDVLDFSRTLDFFIVAGFLFLTGAIFYIYTVLRKTQKKMEEIVRKIAMDNAYKKEK